MANSKNIIGQKKNMDRTRTDYEIWLEGQLADLDFRREYERALDKLRLGSQIAQYREKRGLTQAQLARQVGTNKGEIDRLEMADYDERPVTLLKKVAAALGLAVVVKVELCETGAREAA